VDIIGFYRYDSKNKKIIFIFFYYNNTVKIEIYSIEDFRDITLKEQKRRES